MLDTRASRGSWLVDARDGRRHLDLFSFFASAPLGMNHPALADDPAFRAELTEVALNKPSNSDIYTDASWPSSCDTFSRVLGDPALPHLFLVEGGALAVENALKTAFDWKRRHNAAHGRPAELGTKVLHLRKAFHGRSGYTLSLTNTDPRKTALFPTFDWPRIDVPAIRFPIDVERGARRPSSGRWTRPGPRSPRTRTTSPASSPSRSRARAATTTCARSSCRPCSSCADEHDALFVLDEVQTGCGMTGSAWAYQQLGLRPDVVAFGKKLQVCGIMAGGRVDEVRGQRVPGVRRGSTPPGAAT